MTQFKFNDQEVSKEEWLKLLSKECKDVNEYNFLLKETIKEKEVEGRPVITWWFAETDNELEIIL